MNPLKYQKRVPSVNNRDEEMSLGCLLSSSNAMYCDRCGFATTDPMAFKKHMLEHMTTRMTFYCFYCNHVFYSERDLQAHLHQHTTNYQLRCQYCGLGCASSEHLAKHVQLVHGKCVGLNKPDVSSALQTPASAALPRVRGSDDPPSKRPMVRVTIPPQASQGYNNSRRVNTADKSNPRVKEDDTNMPSVPKGEANLSSAVSTPVQHNRALTVSLPEEVTIPAGCMVELVEVKTVNGTKELKLRLVSQHENESVLKDGRCTITQNTVLHRPLSSTVNNPAPVKLGNVGAFTKKWKQCEKILDVEKPAACDTKIAKTLTNPISTRIRGTKRTLQETVNQNANRPLVLPTKVARGVVDLANEDAQTKTMHSSAAYPSIVPAKTDCNFSSIENSVNTRACVSNNTQHEKNTLVHSSCISSMPNPVRNIPCKLQVTVKKELGDVSAKYNASPDIKDETVKDEHYILGQNPPSIVPATADVPGMSSSICKEEIKPDPAFLIVNAECKDGIETLHSKLIKDPNTSALTQSEPEGFPIISSVFSLSQHLDVQGSIQPLVMALRGIVMDNRVFSDKTSLDHNKTTVGMTGDEKESNVTVGYNHQVKEKEDNKVEQVGTQDASDVKIKTVDTCSQYTQTQNQGVKKEKNSITLKTNTKSYQKSISKYSEQKVFCVKKDTPDTEDINGQTPQLGTHERSDVNLKMVNTCCQTVNENTFGIKVDERSVQENQSHEDSPATGGMQGQIPGLKENCISSRFLIVSLKRIQSGLWQQSPKRLKLKKVSKSKTLATMGNLCDNAIFYPAPLRVDQLVVRPGPNQPVVVLNHPKPKVAKRTGEADIADTETSEVVPSCQILKMRLSKVMGHKYEVIGCTVRVFS